MCNLSMIYACDFHRGRYDCNRYYNQYLSNSSTSLANNITRIINLAMAFTLIHHLTVDLQCTV